MQIAKTKKTSLLSPFSSSDPTLTLKNFVDHKGNPHVIANFANLFVVTIRQGNTIEMVLCNNIVQNASGSATLTVAPNGRDLSGVFPYTGGSTGEDFGSGAEVVNGDDPYTVYQITIAYSNSLVLAGAPNSTDLIKGITERATVVEIDNGTLDGSGDTNAPLGVTAERLNSSKYGVRLPSVQQKNYLNSITGMLVPYIGDTAPTGFLLADGTAHNHASFPELSVLIKGRYGYNAGATCTAEVTDVITAVSHGMLADAIVFFSTIATLPAGLALNTPYYVRDVTGNTFKVAATAGGVAIDITTTGTGIHLFHTQFRVPDLRSSFPVGAGQKTLASTFVAADVDTATDSFAFPNAGTLTAGMAFLFTTTGTVPTPSNGASSGWVSIDINGNISGVSNASVSGNGQKVVVTDQSSSNVSPGTYFVRDWTAGNFRLASSKGGSAIGTGNAGSVNLTPEGFAPSTIYYVVPFTSTRIKLASSRANANAGIFLTVGNQGTGTHTLTLTMTNRILGQSGGAEDHLLTIAEMPSHTHGNAAVSGSAPGGSSGATGQPSSQTTPTGGDTPHNNMPPFVTVLYIIKT